MRVTKSLWAAAGLILATAAAPALAGGFSFGFSYGSGGRHVHAPRYHHRPVVVRDCAPPVIVHRSRYVYNDCAPPVVYVDRSPRYVYVDRSPRFVQVQSQYRSYHRPVYQDPRLVQSHTRYYTPQYRSSDRRVQVQARSLRW